MKNRDMKQTAKYHLKVAQYCLLSGEYSSFLDNHVV